MTKNSLLILLLFCACNKPSVVQPETRIKLPNNDNLIYSLLVNSAVVRTTREWVIIQDNTSYIPFDSSYIVSKDSIITTDLIASYNRLN
jgi:hypothetical protein